MRKKKEDYIPELGTIISLLEELLKLPRDQRIQLLKDLQILCEVNSRRVGGGYNES